MRPVAALALVSAPLLVCAAGCGFPTFAFSATGDAAIGDTALATDASVVDDGAVDETADATLEGASDETADAADDGSSDDAPPEGAIPDPSCPGLGTGQDLSTTVPSYAAGQTPVIDGDGSEWCGVPGYHLDETACNWLVPTTLPSWASGAYANVRVAWIAGADAPSSSIVLDAVVHDTSLLVAPTTSTPDMGASFGFYIAGFSPPTGAYDLSDDIGATAFIFAPPQGDVPARAAIDIDGKDAHGIPSGVQYGARLVTDGYEIEALIPWSVISKPGVSYEVPGPNVTIGLDMTIRVRTSDGDSVRMIWHAGPSGAATSCTGDPLPECDDRVWFQPVLGE